MTSVEPSRRPARGPTIAGGGAIRRWGRRLHMAVVELLVPAVCVACGRRIAGADALCANCWRGVHFIRPPLCDRLGVPMPYDPGGRIVSAGALADPPVYDRARAAVLFGPVVRRLVHGFKYHDQQHARTLLGRWLMLAGDDLLCDADLIVPVPLHRWRLLARRFNQSAMLALEVSRHCGVAVDMSALVRVKRTPPQARQTADQRRRGMAAAFVVPPSKVGSVVGRRIVLVDDVITTGSTANACARALKAVGAAQVDVLSVALVQKGDVDRR